MGVYSGIPREAYDQFMDKTFGGQTLTTLKLLSMTKKPTEEGRYFSEGEFNLAKMHQLGKDTTTDEELEKESKQREEVLSKKMKLDRSKPNAFLAIQVHITLNYKRIHISYFFLLFFNTFLIFSFQLTSPEILSSIEEVQEDCLQADPALKQFVVPIKKAHISLLAFNIQEDEVERVREMVMRILVAKVDRQLLKDKFEVEVKGLDSFDNSGIYAEVEAGDNVLRMFNEVFSDKFEEEGFVCDSRFTPHLSIMKGGSVPDQICKRFADKSFGRQEVSSIHLLSMDEPPTSGGFYHCYGNFKFKYVTAES